MVLPPMAWVSHEGRQVRLAFAGATTSMSGGMRPGGLEGDPAALERRADTQTVQSGSVVGSVGGGAVAPIAPNAPMGSYYFSNIKIYFTYIIKTHVFLILHWSY
jgi:hypothetical protein